MFEPQPLDEERFLSAQDIGLYMSNSLLRLCGRPFYIRKAVDDLRVLGWFPREEEEAIVPVNDRQYTYQAPRVGFINAPGFCGYVKRTPHRTQHIGLVPGTLSLEVVYSSRRDDGLCLDADKPTLKAIAQAMDDVYPTFGECLDIIHGSDAGGSAFERTWAVGLTADLSLRCIQHKTRKVGLFIPSEGRILLSPSLPRSRKAMLDHILQQQGVTYVTETLRA